MAIADVPSPRGGTWNAEGTIIFASIAGIGGLKRVPAAGGTPTPVATITQRWEEDLVTVRWPRFLPDGRRFLYTLSSSKPGLGGLYLGSLDRSGVKIPLSAGAVAGEGMSAAAYVRPRGKHPGYLLWIRANTLMAQPFDPHRMQLSGEAAPVPGADVIGTF
jgi:hypothetical protein